MDKLLGLRYHAGICCGTGGDCVVVVSAEMKGCRESLFLEMLENAETEVTNRAKT